MKIARTLVIALGVTVASCSDNTTEPTIGASGSLAFSYTGAGAATTTQYTATGAIPANVAVNNGSSSWAAGSVQASQNQTSVFGFVPKGNSTWDEAVIIINRTTVGVSAIDPSCTASTCTDMAIFFGANNNETNFTYSCTLTSGTVNITAISSTNVTGTFSGTGTCFQAGGTGTTSFAVTSGTFNVGVTTLLQ